MNEALWQNKTQDNFIFCLEVQDKYQEIIKKYLIIQGIVILKYHEK